MFRDRPKQLFDLPHYRHLPPALAGISVETLPSLLNLDIFAEMRGYVPHTMAISNLCPDGIYENPNKEVVDYYLKRKTQFQLISVVVSCAYFEQVEDGGFAGIPYSVRLFPGTKRGKIEEVDATIFRVIDLEHLAFSDDVYGGFDPFEGTWDICGPYRFFAEKPEIPHFTDHFGFVIRHYALSTDTDPEEALMSGNVDSPPEVFERFRRYRARRYYTPFTDTKPRAVWGCESPIELYLFQALLHQGLRPIPQVRIYRDGSIYPSFHDMFRDDVFKTDSELASTPDLYFKEERVAVYCDSERHHRSTKAQAKDAEVAERVRALGITPIRIPSHTIYHDLDAAVAQVASHLN